MTTTIINFAKKNPTGPLLRTSPRTFFNRTMIHQIDQIRTHLMPMSLIKIS